ncbi:hypothetical protein PIB30_090282 [Stylosanthes scabra]|uniref:Uncharacterized protein n=1 Tax=Stylosanthes scabra TaxID=79078 RepID=A0ABU6VVB9_9FABA|nr:hypothetical protein [Stylosanthes scabra]
MASSSSVLVFDNHRFKSVFNEELYNTIVKNKKVIAESPTHRHGSWRLCMLQPDPTTPRQPLIKSRHGQQLCLSTPRRRNPCICVDRHSSAPEQAEPMPRRDPESLGMEATQSSSSTFRVHA